MKRTLFLLLSLFALAVSPVSVFAHGNHSHHEVKPHQKGVFEDSQVSDRTLSDYSGDWQSVYPYMESGELDMVMRYKSKAEGATKTFEEYKEYYLAGYKTDVTRIVIDGDSGKITFYKGNQASTATYRYDGCPLPLHS